jgi:hypothetical protein
VEGAAWVLCKMEFLLVEDYINFTNQSRGRHSTFALLVTRAWQDAEIECRPCASALPCYNPSPYSRRREFPITICFVFP